MSNEPQTQTEVADADIQKLLSPGSVLELPGETGTALTAVGVGEAVQLINRNKFDDTQIAAVAHIATGFDMDDSNQILEFASEPMRNISARFDEALGNMRAGQAGAAGDLVVALSESIDILNLEKVRAQMQEDSALVRAWNSFLRLLRIVQDHIKLYYGRTQQVVPMFDKMEAKARNQQEILKEDIRKGDRLVDASIDQIKALELFVVAGEDILVREVQRAQTMHAEAVANDDNLQLQIVNDLISRVIRFDNRLLKAKHALTRAETRTIPQIRSITEAAQIEIQNLEDGIVFEIPKLKEAILQFASLLNIKDAQESQKAMEELSAKLDDLVDELDEDVTTAALESQGRGLAQAERLAKNVDRLMERMQRQVAIEKENAGKRAEASRILAESRQQYRDMLEDHNQTRANEALGNV